MLVCVGGGQLSLVKDHILMDIMAIQYCICLTFFLAWRPTDACVWEHLHAGLSSHRGSTTKQPLKSLSLSITKPICRGEMDFLGMTTKDSCICDPFHSGPFSHIVSTTKEPLESESLSISVYQIPNGSKNMDVMSLCLKITRPHVGLGLASLPLALY